MNRGRGNTEIPRPKPVERVQLSEKHTRRRFILVLLLLALGTGMLVHAFLAFLRGDTGWREIQAESASEMNCSEDFVFLYDVGSAGVGTRAEIRALTAAYTEASVQAYQMFNTDQPFPGGGNVYSVNHHPNETVTVDEALYEAFALMERYGGRYLYLGPLYSVYDNLFYCTDDAGAANFDPQRSPEVAEDFAQMLAYAKDPQAVSLELLGGGRVCLHVSEEYLAFAREDGIEDFIDFYWMKNAFIADYLADTMADAGYTCGSVSSYDGFIRNLDERDTPYSFNIYDRVEKEVYEAAVMNYRGRESIVYLRDYPMNSQDFKHYYELEDGEVRTPYLDPADGKNKSAAANLVAYSREESCARVLLSVLPAYIADTFGEEALLALADDGIYSVYCRDCVIYHNDPQLSLSELYNREEICYTETLAGD